MQHKYILSIILGLVVVSLVENIETVEEIASGSSKSNNLGISEGEEISEWLTTSSTDFNGSISAGLNQQAVNGITSTSGDLCEVLTEF